MAVAFEKEYLWEDCSLHPHERSLKRAGVPIRLAKRPYQVLLYLIENRDRWVRRSELLEQFWNGHEVYDEALTKCVGAIRKALGEVHDRHKFIETRWAEGYRFIGLIEAPCSVHSARFEGTGDTRNGSAPNGNGNVAARALGAPVFNDRSEADSSPGFPMFLRSLAARFTAAAALTIVIVGFILLYKTQPFTPASATTDGPIDSVAVLPFKNLSNNPEHDILVEGISESLISALSRVEGLRVISRGSVFAFRDKAVDPTEVGAKLRVASVLEGSVQQSAGRIRIETRLVRTRDGKVLWSADRTERPASDVFEVQDDIARSVAIKLRLELTPTADDRLAKRLTDNPEAHQAYIKGRHFWRIKTRESLERSRKYFEEAIKLDPDYSLAYAGLADYYLSGIWYTKLEHSEATAKAKELISRVLEIDPTLPEAHDGLSRIAGMEWDWPTALREKEMSLELNPNNASVWQGYAFLLAGQPEQSLKAIRRAHDLDPLSVNIATDIGVLCVFAGRFDEAIEAFHAAIALDPLYADAHYNLGIAYEQKGLDFNAYKAYLEADRLNGASVEDLAEVRTAFHKGGLKAVWGRHLASYKKAGNRSEYWLGALYAHLGESEPAIESLRRAVEAREPMAFNMKLDRKLNSLRHDPRFVELVNRVGL